MDKKHFEAPAPAPDSPGGGLAGVNFPDEAALGDTISETQAAADQRAEALARAVESGVSAWLKEQGVDPEHPPEHWGAESEPPVDQAAQVPEDG